MKHYRLEIEGMGCNHCVRNVEKALLAMGAAVNDVQIGLADVLWDGEKTALQNAVEESGYDVKSIVAL